MDCQYIDWPYMVARVEEVEGGPAHVQPWRFRAPEGRDAIRGASPPVWLWRRLWRWHNACINSTAGGRGPCTGQAVCCESLTSRLRCGFLLEWRKFGGRNAAAVRRPGHTAGSMGEANGEGQQSQRRHGSHMRNGTRSGCVGAGTPAAGGRGCGGHYGIAVAAPYVAGELRPGRRFTPAAAAGAFTGLRPAARRTPPSSQRR
jgi:hypothetical protein